MSAIKELGTDHRTKFLTYSQLHYYRYFLVLAKCSPSCPYASHIDIKCVCGSGVTAAFILNFGARYRKAVNFQSSQLYTRGKNPPIDTEWETGWAPGTVCTLGG
jgi:hypothetical protein